MQLHFLTYTLQKTKMKDRLGMSSEEHRWDLSNMLIQYRPLIDRLTIKCVYAWLHVITLLNGFIPYDDDDIVAY